MSGVGFVSWLGSQAGLVIGCLLTPFIPAQLAAVQIVDKGFVVGFLFQQLHWKSCLVTQDSQFSLVGVLGSIVGAVGLFPQPGSRWPG